MSVVYSLQAWGAGGREVAQLVVCLSSHAGGPEFSHCLSIEWVGQHTSLISALGR